MSNFMNHLKTVNSSVRTLLALGLCGAVGYGGYFGYENYVKPSQQARQALADLEQLQVDFQQQSTQLVESRLALEKSEADLKIAAELNERLETSMKLLKVDRRVANLKVIAKGQDENGEPFMEVSFTEIDGQGQQVGVTKDYVLKGEKVYVDGWIATFEDKYIEEADELRAASLFVFKSIYGDAEMPKDAQRLDVETLDGPGIYFDPRKREFEQQIWGDFWKVCNDSALQRELGIRTSQGQTSYVQPQVGKTYQINIRASGGMSLNPVD